jgi:prepilin-type N-terminal cleavage/methylation domain-containing protein
MSRTSRTTGFTLVELAVVIAVIAILMSLTLPAVMMAREASRRVQCASNLRQIGFALHGHHDQHMAFPPGFTSPSPSQRYPYVTWLTRILPYIEERHLWNSVEYAYARNRSPFFTPEHFAIQVPIGLFACPNDGRVTRPQMSRNHVVALTSYLGVSGTDIETLDGALYIDSRVRIADIRDGTSNTVVVGERPPSADMWYGWWYVGDGVQGRGVGDMVLGMKERNFTEPDTADCPYGPYQFSRGNLENQCDLFHFWSLHPEGGYFLLADGSVQFVVFSGEAWLSRAATISGQEPP